MLLSVLLYYMKLTSRRRAVGTHEKLPILAF